MTVQNLNFMFRPSSVALIGASSKPESVGGLVMRNLLQARFDGPVMPVNPNAGSVFGVLAYPEISALPIVPELAIIATPPDTVRGFVRQLGERGTKGAVLMCSPDTRDPRSSPAQQMREALDLARSYGLRILGPNSLGLSVPGMGVNASFSHTEILHGKVAFVSQSNAMCTTVLDWAYSSGIGFSNVVSLGEMGDIDFADMLDYLGSDPSTHAVLLYVESIKNARRFMSAARSAARNKPVLAIKADRQAHGRGLDPPWADRVYDAAFARAGMLRVHEVDELFDAVETLARARPLRGDRLAILSNGSGPGTVAADYLSSQGGCLADIDPDLLADLDGVLPVSWSRKNPIDIAGTRPDRFYGEALRVLLKSKGVDAVLVMHAPCALTPPEASAKAVVEEAQTSRRNLLTCWLGRPGAQRARDLFREAGIPTYGTPEKAVRAYLHMVHYRRNQEMLMETPPSVPSEFTPDIEAARQVVRAALSEGRQDLTELEAKQVLLAYGVPVVEAQVATTPDEAGELAQALGFPVAVKILSPDTIRKSDVGGVTLDLETRKSVVKAAAAMVQRVQQVHPEARIHGFSVQRMARRPGAHELVVGVTTDQVFGPVMVFGQGGVAVDVIDDRAVALPPLNMNLAKELISRTRVSRLLHGYRERIGADLDAVKLVLIQVSQIVVDLPEIAELEINPLFADQEGVVAVDTRIRVKPASLPGPGRLAIRPYPKELEEKITIKGGLSALLRPIRPEDEPTHHVFISRLTPEDIRFRFFGVVREIPHSQMARFTQIDYDRDMAFIATSSDERGKPETLGVVRTITDPDNHRTEFSIVVRSDLKGKGLGKALMDKMIRYCRSRGTHEIFMQTLPDNRAMLGLARKYGFSRETDGETVDLLLTLNGAS